MKSFFKSMITLLLVAAGIMAKAQVPIYNSYLTANQNLVPTIYLDFDGQTVSGTSWNALGDIYCAPSGMTTDQITEAFNRVAEDYRPFTVNITTDSTKYWSAPYNKRMRVIITVTYEWYDNTAGGTSFVNSFIRGDNTPCFVFSSLLGVNNTKKIAEAAAHEAGHTLGLRHQSTYDAGCNKTNEYNPGQGGGEIGWAPIMGNSYTHNMSLWHSGPNSNGCNVIQNDLSIITSAVNGITLRTDDYAAVMDGTASAASFTNNAFTVNGIITSNTDQDVIRFDLASANRFTLDAIPYNVGTGSAGSDLDMQVSLYNSAQALLGTYNPGTLLSSVIDTTLGSGIYYLKVEGKGNIYAPNYASIGSYALQAQKLPVTTLPVHKLELRGTYEQSRHILNWIVEADESITEQILEVSTDGRNFRKLIQTGTADRAYSYMPATTGTAVYRLSVKFDNNSHYYSNAVTIREYNGVQKPKVVNTLVTNDAVAVSSPGSFEFLLSDMNGKVLNKGKITAGMNTVTASNLISGLYIIRFSDGMQQWTEKIVKQ